MRAFLATLSADPVSPDRLAADAAVLAAESDLLQAWRADDDLFAALAESQTDPWNDLQFLAARARLLAAGRRLARTPAVGPLGLALKVRYMALDTCEGRSDWAEILALQTLADAVRQLRSPE
jgi:hypothetical protein